MKYILTESQFEDGVINYLNEMYGDLNKVEQSEYWGLVNYEKNGKVYIQLNTKKNEIWFPKTPLSQELVEVFNLSSSEIKDILSKWVGETYGITNITPNKVETYLDYEEYDDDDDEDEENDD